MRRAVSIGVVCIRDERPRNQGSGPGRSKIFLLSVMLKQALMPAHPHVQWIPGEAAGVGN
jgi:hypothetical protein